MYISVQIFIECNMAFVMENTDLSLNGDILVAWTEVEVK